MRVNRVIRLLERYKLNFAAEAFNLTNRDNQRVSITSNGMVTSAGMFVQSSVTANIAPYPGYYTLPDKFHEAERRLRATADSAVDEIHFLRMRWVGQQIPPPLAFARGRNDKTYGSHVTAPCVCKQLAAPQSQLDAAKDVFWRAHIMLPVLIEYERVTLGPSTRASHSRRSSLHCLLPAIFCAAHLQNSESSIRPG